MALEKKTHYEDLLLAEACLQGDNASTAQIHSLYDQRLLGLLIGRGATTTEAADLLGDLWGECVAGRAGHQPLLGKYHGKCALYTWLASVATHRLVDLKRRQRFQGSLPGSSTTSDLSGDEFDRLPSPSTTPAEPALTRLMRTALQKAFAECPPETFLLLQLVYLHGIMQREAARVYGWHESKISRTLDGAMTQIATRTLSHLRASDPGLDVTWADFTQLCQCTDDLFEFK